MICYKVGFSLCLYLLLWFCPGIFQIEGEISIPPFESQHCKATSWGWGESDHLHGNKSGSILD